MHCIDLHKLCLHYSEKNLDLGWLVRNSPNFQPGNATRARRKPAQFHTSSAQGGQRTPGKTGRQRPAATSPPSPHRVSRRPARVGPRVRGAGRAGALTPPALPPRRPLQPSPPAARQAAAVGARQEGAALRSGWRRRGRSRPPCATACGAATPAERAERGGRGRRGGNGGRRGAGQDGPLRARPPAPFVRLSPRLSARRARVIAGEGLGWGCVSVYVCVCLCVCVRVCTGQCAGVCVPTGSEVPSCPSRRAKA